MCLDYVVDCELIFPRATLSVIWRLQFNVIPYSHRGALVYEYEISGHRLEGGEQDNLAVSRPRHKPRDECLQSVNMNVNKNEIAKEWATLYPKSQNGTQIRS